MKILISAYSCEPEKGSEPGAGFAIVQAAARLGECWVLTRTNNVAAVEQALAADPPPHPVHVIAVDAGEQALRVKRRFGAIRTYNALWQRHARRVARELDREQGGFDLVHHATMSALWMPIGVADLGRPLVVGPLAGGEMTPRRLVPFLGWRGAIYDGLRWVNVRAGARLRRRTWQRTSVFIAQNHQCADFIRTHLAPGERPLYVHPNATDLDLAPPTDTSERTTEVVFVGELLPQKGILLAIDAFARSRSTDATLVVIGDGQAHRIAEQRAARRGLGSRVVFEGALPRDEVLRRLRRARCLVFPSLHDSAGFVVSEALSLGTPVVCLDHAGPGTLVELWPDVASAAVPVQGRRATVQGVADAIDQFVAHPAPVPVELQHPTDDLAQLVTRAYSAAVDTDVS